MTVKSCNTSEFIYFVKIAEKNVTKENLTDLDMKYPPRECYLKGFYLKKGRSKNINIKYFSIINYDVYLTLDKIFEPFVEISNDLTMKSDVYLKLLERIQFFIDKIIFSLIYESTNDAQLNVCCVFHCFMQTNLGFM